MRRTQIYLDDRQERALRERAREVGQTKSAVIREAIDAYLAPGEDDDIALQRFRAAIAEASGVAPYLPPGAEYVDEVRAADLRRQRELDERRAG